VQISSRSRNPPARAAKEQGSKFSATRILGRAAGGQVNAEAEAERFREASGEAGSWRRPITRIRVSWTWEELLLALVFFLGAVGKSFFQENQVAAEFELGENPGG